MSAPAIVRRLPLILLATVATGYALWLVWRTHAYGIDYIVYRDGARTLLSGGSLYDDVHVGKAHLQFTYPPFAAALLAPLAVIPLDIGRTAWGLINVAALFGVARLIAVRMPALAGKRELRISPWTITWVIFALGTLMEPIEENFRFHQPSIVLLLVLLFDTTRKNKWTGILTGLAAGFKVTPGLFIVFMLLTRRWADAARAVTAFAVTIVIGALFGVGQEWRYWTSTLYQTDRVGGTDRLSNGSLTGLVTREVSHAHAGQYSLIAVAIVLIAGMALAVLWWQRDRLIAATIVGLTTVLVSPISWIHHWVWLLPGIAVLAALAVRATHQARRATLVLTAAASVAAAFITITHARRWWKYIGGSHIVPIGAASYSMSGLLALAALGAAIPLVPRAAGAEPEPEAPSAEGGEEPLTDGRDAAHSVHPDQ